MKNMIFSLLAAAALVGCDNKNEATISGAVTGVEDGAEVALSSDRRGKDVLATTTVADGKFQFKVEGQTEAVVQFLKIDGSNATKRPYAVVVENGTIAVDVQDAKISVTGTALNDKYTAFMAQPKDEAQGVEQLKGFIKENITNVLGVSLFEANAYRFNLDELKATYALVPVKLQGLATMVKIKNSIETLEATAVGSKFVDIKGLTPDGNEVALSDFAGKGKIVLIDFWASWCPYCIAEMPDMVAAYDKYKSKGFEIVGVSLDHEVEAWTASIAKEKLAWPHMSDLKGWESELSKTYAIFSLPQTILIDKDGTIIEKQVKGKDLEAKLAELLK